MRHPRILLAVAMVGLGACARRSTEVAVASPQTEKAAVVRGQEPDKSSAAKQQSTQAPGFEFPGDQGGQLVRRQLTPRDTLPREPGQAPLRRKPLARVEDPSLPLSIVVLAPPRLSFYGPARPARPVFATPETWLGELGLTALPETQTMPTGPLLRVPGVNVNRPIGLAPTAQPLSGREPLTDPTRAAAAAAVLRTPMPQRTKPAAFVPENLPDPFENQTAIRSLASPGDEALPLTSGSDRPKK